MINRCLVGLVVCAALIGGRAAAEKVDFDQGVDVRDAVAALKAATNAGGTGSNTVRTYTVDGNHSVHAKGFRHHEGGKRDYKTADTLGLRVSQAIPDTYDLRPQLTQIENQGQCGDCWAFSLTATNRDGHALMGSDPGRLSQEWLNDTDPNYATQAPAYGCNGGDFDAANNLLKGQPSWDACPYTAGASGTVSNPCSATLPGAANGAIKGWHMLGDANAGPSARDIETEIASSGKPISIAIAAGAGDWEGYSGGVYNGCVAGAQLDHMINIVGWDNEGAAFDANGNLPPGKGVWILRNSWGTSWGEDGYMRTKMTDASGARCNNVAGEAAYFDF
jgi:hypothetical protein